MAVAVDPRPGTIRERLTSISPDLADDAEAALREALKSTKRVRANRECVKCGCTHVDYVDVQDSPKVLEAIKLAIEQTEGRPGVAEEANSTLTMQRIRLDPADLELQAVLGQAAIERALRLLDKGNVDELKALLLHHAPRP